MYDSINDFERALAHFGTRVEIICALEMGGKIDSDLAYRNIKLELKQLKKSRKRFKKNMQSMPEGETT